MRVEFLTYDEGQLFGKIVMRPESHEEREAMNRFRRHIGSRQRRHHGRFEVIYPRLPQFVAATVSE